MSWIVLISFFQVKAIEFYNHHGMVNLPCKAWMLESTWILWLFSFLHIATTEHHFKIFLERRFFWNKHFGRIVNLCLIFLFGLLFPIVFSLLFSPVNPECTYVFLNKTLSSKVKNYCCPKLKYLLMEYVERNYDFVISLSSKGGNNLFHSKKKFSCTLDSNFRHLLILSE